MDRHPTVRVGRVTGRMAVMITLLVGCVSAPAQNLTVPQAALPSGLPQSAHEAAVNRILEAGKPGFQDGPCHNGGAIECRDFQVTCARLLQASEAAAGQVSWCVHESYLRRFKPDGEWTTSVRPVEIAQQGSSWDVTFALCACE